MKLIIRYLILLIILSTTLDALSQESGHEKFGKGVSFFTSGDYQNALQTWSELYNIGYRSAELNYNIGNVYFKLNNIPDAILYYERAYLLKPLDEDINYNLQIARTHVVDRFQEIPELFFIRWYNIVSLLLSSNSWAKISIASFFLTLLFVSLYIYSSGYRQKVIGFWFAIFFLITSLSGFAFSGRNKNLIFDSRKAIISSSLVSGKSSPDNSGTDLFVLHDGTKVSIEDEVGDWYEIRLSDGNKGWIPSNTLNII
jgi:tetratricopeptide (TPR) repeat protein